MRRLIALLCALAALSATRAFAEKHSVIVLSQDDRTVYDLNPTTGQVLKQVALAGAPREAIFSWNEQSLFVSVPDAGQVAIIDVKTFKQTGQIENAEFKRPMAGASSSPLGLATTPDGTKLYIGIEGGLVMYDSKLLVLTPEWKQTGKKIAVTPKDGQTIRYQGTTGKLYYPHRRDNQVVVIDTSTDSVVKTVAVAGGPMDVAFVPGSEAWVLGEDGSITVIDTSNDEVKQVIRTTGKGRGRITIAPDIRFVAATHADTGDTTILHPLKKEVVGTVKTGRGPGVPTFVPAAKIPQDFQMKDPTSQLYVTNAADSNVAVVNLDTMAVSSQQKAGKGLVGSLIHYVFPEGFGPPREGTTKRVFENDVVIARLNAMFLYDVSPVHEHRYDMVGIFTGTGVAKIGCWVPECPEEVVEERRASLTNPGPGGLPYLNGEGAAGNMTNITRGTIHMEEGGSPSPRRFVLFDIKNNYYRQTQAPRPSLLEKTPLRKIGENPRAASWAITLRPGDKPLSIPDGDFAVVYLGGGLLKFVRDGKPEIVNRYFNEWQWESKAHTVESLSNPVHMVFVEFK